MYTHVFPDLFDPLSCGRFERRSETLTCVFLTRRVTTADLASPETEVPPALRLELPSITGTRKRKCTPDPSIWTFSESYLYAFAFVLTCRVLVDSPEPLDFQE